ncbi:hypothetical protein A9168_07485 [Macellibacteroides sp. HH-ZS]|nr:hypothetical protein A9168_07485 [Macellibacteroides sp. HH-ZS]
MENEELGNAPAWAQTLLDQNKALADQLDELKRVKKEGVKDKEKDDDKSISPSVQQWVKDKEEDRFGGKDLHGKTPFNPNPQKKDQGPTTLNGVLTGKTI